MIFHVNFKLPLSISLISRKFTTDFYSSILFGTKRGDLLILSTRKVNKRWPVLSQTKTLKPTYPALLTGRTSGIFSEVEMKCARSVDWTDVS